MDTIIAIIFGIVQGVTEFIPVSSSGHLLLLHVLFPSFEAADALAFDVALHIGTLVAVIAVFWRDLVRYVKEDRRMLQLILIGIIPAGLAGFFFEEIIDTMLRSPWVVVVMLIVVALVFLWIETLPPERFQQTIGQLTWKKALFIGVMQILALVPGTSRSGITMVGGMIGGLKREDAARFSFLLSIPLILAAAGKKSIDVMQAGISPDQMQLMIIGIVSSGVVGYLAISFLLRYLATHTLRIFAVYRIVLAIVVACLLLLV